MVSSRWGTPSASVNAETISESANSSSRLSLNELSLTSVNNRRTASEPVTNASAAPPSLLRVVSPGRNRIPLWRMADVTAPAVEMARKMMTDATIRDGSCGRPEIPSTVPARVPDIVKATYAPMTSTESDTTDRTNPRYQPRRARRPRMTRIPISNILVRPRLRSRRRRARDHCRRCRRLCLQHRHCQTRSPCRRVQV